MGSTGNWKGIKYLNIFCAYACSLICVCLYTYIHTHVHTSPGTGILGTQWMKAGPLEEGIK